MIAVRSKRIRVLGTCTMKRVNADKNCVNDISCLPYLPCRQLLTAVWVG